MSRFQWPKPPMHLALKERLEWWSIPEPNSGCWIWFGQLAPNGYPQLSLRVNGKLITGRAHRLSFETYKGPIPAEQFVCHRCDLKCCINPDHLFAGTPRDNNHDMIAKGRARYNPGERNGQARLTADLVLAIRNDGRTLDAIARDYGLSFQHVSDIKNGRRWKHVGGPIGHRDHRRAEMQMK